jgi:exosortase A-associated hydrolase 2
MLASQGIGTLVLDAYGTGDSGGEFTDHTWDGWKADILTAIEWLRSRPGGCDTIWGVRVGAMLASQMALDTDGIHNVLLWQPVLSGKVFFNQMLRIRVAADLADPNGIKKTDDLRKVLAAGDRIEVAGYEITPDLAAGIEAAAMPAAEAVSARRVAWFEVVAQESQPVGRVNQQYIEALQTAGGKLHTETLVGELFWQVHERAVAPALLDATQRAVASWS